MKEEVYVLVSIIRDTNEYGNIQNFGVRIKAIYSNYSIAQKALKEWKNKYAGEFEIQTINIEDDIL